MTIEEEVFAKQRPDRTTFAAAGLVKQGQDYVIHQDMLDGQFTAIVTVNHQGQVHGRVIDKSTDDDYLPLRAAHLGPFASQVKAAYVEFLQNLRQQCFVSQPFIGDQANRLAAWVDRHFHDQPEFVFQKLPDYAAFREPQSQKWYGLVMNIPRARLKKKTAAAKGPRVEVIDLRCTPQQRATLLAFKGVYPGYHLNRKNWVCVTLDDQLADQQLFSLVERSRGLLTQPRFWLVPANPHYYDIMHAFDHHDTLIWKQSTKVRVGDTVFLYVSAPIKAIIYRCQVVETDIPYHYDSPQLTIKQVMRLRFVKEYDHQRFCLPFIKQHGVTSVQGPRHVPAELLQLLLQQ